MGAATHLLRIWLSKLVEWRTSCKHRLPNLPVAVSTKRIRRPLGDLIGRRYRIPGVSTSAVSPFLSASNQDKTIPDVKFPAAVISFRGDSRVASARAHQQYPGGDTFTADLLVTPIYPCEFIPPEFQELVLLTALDCVVQTTPEEDLINQAFNAPLPASRCLDCQANSRGIVVGVKMRSVVFSLSPQYCVNWLTYFILPESSSGDARPADLTPLISRPCITFPIPSQGLVYSLVLLASIHNAVWILYKLNRPFSEPNGVVLQLNLIPRAGWSGHTSQSDLVIRRRPTIVWRDRLGSLTCTSKSVYLVWKW